MAVFCPGGPNFDHFFTIFCKSLLNMPKNIILKNKKISLSRKISKSKKLRKWQKRAKNGCFFGPIGPNFDRFFTIFFQITSKYAQKHHIKKNRKNSLSKKFLSPKTAKIAKKGPKMAVFWPSRAEF